MSTNPLLIALGQALPDIGEQIRKEKLKAKRQKVGTDIQGVLLDEGTSGIEKLTDISMIFSSNGMIEQANRTAEKAISLQTEANKFERQIAGKDTEFVRKTFASLLDKFGNTTDLNNWLSNQSKEVQDSIIVQMPDNIKLGKTNAGQTLQKAKFTDHRTGLDYYAWADPNDPESDAKPIKINGKIAYYDPKKAETVVDIASQKKELETGEQEKRVKKKTEIGEKASITADFQGSLDNKDLIVTVDKSEILKDNLSKAKDLPATWGPLQSQIARGLAGEKGVLTEQDVARNTGSEDLASQFKRFMDKKLSGRKLTPRDVQNFIAMIDNINRLTKQQLSKRAKQFAVSRGKEVEGIDEDFVSDILSDYILDTETKAEQQTKKTINLPFKTLKEGIDLYKRRTGKTPSLKAQLKMQELLGE